MLRYQRADTQYHLECFRRLVIEYAREMGFDLEQPKLKQELAGLPGEYAPPRGCLLLAMAGERAVGCIALRKLGEVTAEIRRLYIDREFRRQGIARGLTTKVVEEAHRIGCRQVRLITLPQMENAISLYRNLGFRFIPAYRPTTADNALFMELSIV
ncbi:MAG: GNAT family N-acetyltransferase [Syntrophomonadaceae bacterium]|nr:GNAT family N-acetyltransferase [Syntrophomonadaceae bacterium]